METLENKEVKTLSELISVFESDHSDLNYEILFKEGLHYCNLWNVLKNFAKSNENLKINFYIGKYLSQELKAYVIFIRNAALETIYAQLKLNALIINEIEFEEYLVEAQEHIEKVRDEFSHEIQNVDETISNSDTSEMALQSNPIEIYSEQFAVLNTQLREVRLFGDQCLIAQRRLEFLADKIRLQFNERIEGLQLLKLSISKILENKDNDLNVSQELKRNSKLLDEFTGNPLNDIDAKKIFGSLDTINAIPEYEYGVLKSSTVNFPIGIKQIITMNFGTEIKTQNQNVSITLSDVISQLRLLSDQSELKKKDSTQVKDYHDILNNHIVVEKNILSKIKGSISLHSLIYKNGYLKDTSADYGTENLKRAKDFVLGFIRSPKQQLINWSDTFISRNVDLTENQRIINYIKVFHKENNNENYSKIFLNNSEFFNHYFVDRVELTSRIQLNIDNWKLKLGNAILMHGDRYSGKTSLLSWIESHTEFHQKIQISIGKNVIVGGRKILFSSDLSDGINDIMRSIDKNKTYAILIDDLEVFVKDDLMHRNGENLNALIKHLGNAPKNVFFILAVNSWMATRINTMYSWKEHFADIIDVSKFKLNQFLQTIETRHESTKMPVTLKGIPLDDSQIRTIGMEIFKTCHGNVGLSLMAWCRNISNDLKIKSTKWKLPNFPWLVDDVRRFFDIFALNKKLSFNEVIKLDNITEPINNKLIGRFRKIGILKTDDTLLMLSPFVEREIVSQLYYCDRKDKYNRYLLEVHYDESIEESAKTLFNLLFTFPYVGEAKLYNIKSISVGICHVELKTIEPPASIIRYLNNHSEFKTEYKNNV